MHDRLCQLSLLTTYVKGMGLEDLEGCERFFLKSNALASSLRYASIFHGQQKIVEFTKHMDNMETYQNLSRFSISPPFPNLSWDDVVKYAFLADFYLLRGSRQDVRDRP